MMSQITHDHGKFVYSMPITLPIVVNSVIKRPAAVQDQLVSLIIGYCDYWDVNKLGVWF